MAINVFLILCGLSVAFLVYVLLQLHEEGRRPPKGAESDVAYRSHLDPDVIVVTHPISLSAQGGISVLPLKLQVQGSAKKRGQSADIADVLEMPAKSLSRRRGSSRRGSEIKAR